MPKRWVRPGVGGAARSVSWIQVPCGRCHRRTASTGAPAGPGRRTRAARRWPSVARAWPSQRSWGAPSKRGPERHWPASSGAYRVMVPRWSRSSGAATARRAGARATVAPKPAWAAGSMGWTGAAAVGEAEESGRGGRRRRRRGGGAPGCLGRGRRGRARHRPRRAGRRSGPGRRRRRGGGGALRGRGRPRGGRRMTRRGRTHGAHHRRGRPRRRRARGRAARRWCGAWGPRRDRRSRLASRWAMATLPRKRVAGVGRPAGR